MGALLSALAWVSEVEFSWLEVAECGVQADAFVLVVELMHFALGDEIVVSVVVLALVSHGADPALDGAVGFGVVTATPKPPTNAAIAP